MPKRRGLGAQILEFEWLWGQRHYLGTWTLGLTGGEEAKVQ